MPGSVERAIQGIICPFSSSPVEMSSYNKVFLSRLESIVLLSMGGVRGDLWEEEKQHFDTVPEADVVLLEILDCILNSSTLKRDLQKIELIKNRLLSFISIFDLFGLGDSADEPNFVTPIEESSPIRLPFSTESMECDETDSLTEIEDPIADLKTEAAALGKAIEHSSPENPVLIQMGYGNSGPGHAIIYEFMKVGDGLELVLYQDGDGIEHHDSIELRRRHRGNITKYSPSCRFVSGPSIWNSLTILTETLCDFDSSNHLLSGKVHVNSMDIYQFLRKYFTQQPSTLNRSHYLSPSKSNSCMATSYLSYFRGMSTDGIPELSQNEYKRIVFFIKMIPLVDFIFSSFGVSNDDPPLEPPRILAMCRATWRSLKNKYERRFRVFLPHERNEIIHTFQDMDVLLKAMEESQDFMGGVSNYQESS